MITCRRILVNGGIDLKFMKQSFINEMDNSSGARCTSIIKRIVSEISARRRVKHADKLQDLIKRMNTE